ncbi:MAG TPA: hypothetical protein VFO01_12880 [Trebonia sp.]|nr:hypothetical protein [Trebonia sp.]
MLNGDRSAAGAVPDGVDEAVVSAGACELTAGAEACELTVGAGGGGVAVGAGAGGVAVGAGGGELTADAVDFAGEATGQLALDVSVYTGCAGVTVVETTGAGVVETAGVEVVEAAGTGASAVDVVAAGSAPDGHAPAGVECFPVPGVLAALVIGVPEGLGALPGPVCPPCGADPPRDGVPCPAPTAGVPLPSVPAAARCGPLPPFSAVPA